jgi:transposase InsO family protein
LWFNPFSKHKEVERMNDLQAQREQAMHLLRAGLSTQAVAAQLGRSPQWVRKCRRGFEAAGWAGLVARSRAPHQHGRRTSEAVRQAVKKARSELEAEAARGGGLKYIGGIAVRTRLKAQPITPLPSARTIERILRAAKMTQVRSAKPQIAYPHLRPTQPGELCQIDHIPRYLQGGEPIYCFNAIDVVSRYPTGQAKADRRAATAADFLVHVWQTLGLSTYTQVDNEACFSGGFTHPYVLGQCVRLALMVGTELVFSPVQHPQSNGYVERFHQDYQKHVWDDTYLADPPAVQSQAEHFFALYRHSAHHSALQGQTPDERHRQVSPTRLSPHFTRPAGKLALYAGRVHVIRRVNPDGTVSVLNVKWPLPHPDCTRGVWVTLEINPQGATLSIFDQAPDVAERRCLAVHPFPLSEPVLEPAPAQEQPTPPAEMSSCQVDQRSKWLAFSLTLRPKWPWRLGSRLSRAFRSHTRRFRRSFSETFY